MGTEGQTRNQQRLAPARPWCSFSGVAARRPKPRAGGTAASLGTRGVNRAGRTGIPPWPWEDAGTAEPGRTRDSRARKDQQLASNLTRDEARDRARLLDVGSYRVKLDLTGGETTFTSVSTVRFRCARPGATTFIDLTAPAVSTITLNAATVSLDAFDGNRIRLERLQADNELRVVSECAYSRSGEGLHRFTDPADGGVYLYSDLETFDAHQVYACFDQPDLKATFQFAVRAPEDWLVVSNMAPDVTPQDGFAGEGGEGAYWHFPPTPLLPAYITAVAAGPYHLVRGEHDGIPLGIYCRQSLARYLDSDEIFEVTRQGLDYFQQVFGRRYPFGKYDQLFV